jgi:serine/threonine protein kinase
VACYPPNQPQQTTNEIIRAYTTLREKGFTLPKPEPLFVSSAPSSSGSGTLWVASEFHGPSLRDEIKERCEQNQHFEPVELLQLSRQLADGLAALHDLGFFLFDLDAVRFFVNFLPFFCVLEPNIFERIQSMFRLPWGI